jgi:drug/metabolite transporter (DMT)-like permease
MPNSVSSPPSPIPLATSAKSQPFAFTAVAGLMIASSSWGIIWYPYRAMEDAGLPAPIATFCAYLVGVLFASLFFGRVWREFPRYAASLFIIGLTAGVTNVAFLVAIMEAEVVRVVLLFYLAPLWTIPMAHVLLKEKINRVGIIAIIIAMSGAVVMLWRPELGAPLPKNPHEWLGVLGGFAFALCNVLVRRETRATPEAKSLAGAIGVAMVAIPVAFLLVKSPIAAWPQLVTPHLLLIVIVGVVMMSSSVAMQYGLTKLSANRAAVILLFELIVAAIAAHYLAHEVTRLQEWIGGAMIVAAGLLVTFWVPKDKNNS